MSFQMLPLALRKNPGSPTAKLLLIYLMHECDLPHPDGFDEYASANMNIYWKEAAQFCQVSLEQIYVAREELERARLVFPNPQWEYHNRDGYQNGDRWDFVQVALPLSGRPPTERKRIKAAEDQMDAILARDGFRCVACGIKEGDDPIDWHVDHIIPRSQGGADVEENCQALCGKCNSRKGPKLHWVDFLGGRK